MSRPADRLRRKALALARRARPLTLAMLAVSLLAALGAFVIAERAAFSRLQAGLDQTLIVNRRAIESEIERFRYLPRILGEDVRIRRLLSSPDSRVAQAIANAYLDKVSRQSGAAQLYVLNEQGLTLAASNYREPGSFVGSNYSFRPYFTDAMARGEGRFYAIGVTTGRPGYFLSSRLDFEMTDGRRITGVVVAKVELEPLEAAWRSAAAQTAIIDRSGVVVLSGNPAWKYRPLHPLDAETRARILRERTYEGIDPASAPPLTDNATEVVRDGAMLTGSDSGGPLYARFKRIEPDGWLLLAAAGTAEVRSSAWFWAAAVLLVGLLATGAMHYLEQRRLLLRLRLRQTEMLEQMVEERTRELGREIEMRRRTEVELRATQEGLIHSEKMAALGRMSSAIVHEVSQPLAALETTLATAETLAGREKAPSAGERVRAARALIRRMQRTVRHLKDFARKDDHERSLIDVDEAIRNALDVTRPRASIVGVAPEFVPEGPAPAIFAVQVKIEQVLINLLVNAFDAVEAHGGQRVTIERSVVDGRVEITVDDDGGGIPPDLLPRIEEPFFSTKLSGEGLGLGLSISTAILREFHGDLRFVSTHGEGTRAIVTLPLAASRIDQHKAAAE